MKKETAIKKKQLERKLKKSINKPEKDRKWHKRCNFSDKTHPTSAIISVLFAAISIVTIFALCIYSGLQGGIGTLFMGLIGIIALFLSIAGFILAVISFKKNEIHYRFPVLGLFFNGVMMVGLIILYTLGTLM